MSSKISWPVLKKPSKLNAYQILIISFLVLATAFKCFLHLKQIIFLRSVKFPAEFAIRKIVNEATWKGNVKKQMIVEGADLVYTLVDGGLEIFVVLFGILPWLWQVSSQIMFVEKIADKRSPIRAEVLQSIVFSVVIALANQLIKLPFSLLANFVGARSPVIAVIIAALQFIAAPIAAFIATGTSGTIMIKLWHRFSSYFFMLDPVIFLTVLSLFNVITYLIMSNTPSLFRHLGTDEFGVQASALANKLGFPVERIFISSLFELVNAHFIGGLLPFASHITIYQGLLDKFTVPAAITIMGHELGHWYLMHTYKLSGFAFLTVIAAAVLFYLMAFRPGIYTALGFEPPKSQKEADEELQRAAQTASTGAPPRKNVTKFKSWLMPYYIVITVFAYYERPLVLLSTHAIIALAHMHEFEADKFGAIHTNKRDAIDAEYLLHKHGALKVHGQSYTGVGDPFVDYCTRTHPHTVNRVRAIEEL